MTSGANNMEMEKETKDLLEELKSVADDFYQNRNNKGIKRMPEVIRNLSDFITCLKPEEQPEYLMILKGVMEAMETKNYIMLADMLVFDVVGVVERY